MISSVVVVLVGLPATGKTTFSKLCESYFQNKAFTVQIFHYDDLCKTFSSEERKCVLNQVEHFVLKSQNSNNKHIIIIDDNNYYNSMRVEYFKMCRRLNLGYLIICFELSLETSLQRNESRDESAKVPSDVIKDMFSKFELPKDFDFCICVNSENNSYDFDYIEKRIQQAANNPLVPVDPLVVVPMTQSQLQKIDLALRKIVHKKILQDKSRAKEFNLLKKQLYLKICSKEVFVADIEENETWEDELEKYFV